MCIRDRPREESDRTNWRSKAPEQHTVFVFSINKNERGRGERERESCLLYTSLAVQINALVYCQSNYSILGINSRVR